MQVYNPNANPPQCDLPAKDGCLQDTDVPVTECDGRRTCSFSQEITIFKQGISALCLWQRDANFVRVEFTCVLRAQSLTFFWLTVVVMCVL